MLPRPLTSRPNGRYMSTGRGWIRKGNNASINVEPFNLRYRQTMSASRPPVERIERGLDPGYLNLFRGQSLATWRDHAAPPFGNAALPVNNFALANNGGVTRRGTELDIPPRYLLSRRRNPRQVRTPTHRMSDGSLHTGKRHTSKTRALLSVA